MPKKTQILEMDAALSDLQELIDLSAKHSFDISNLFYRVSNSGAAIFGINGELTTTNDTGHLVVYYKLADEILSALAALRNVVKYFHA